MKRSLLLMTSLVLTSMIPALADHHEEFVSLFDGKTLEGWKSNNEKPDVFTVVDGAIQVKGGRAHLFYDGEVNGGKFKNFDLKMKVKTTKGANGGFYFHTGFQEEGWPEKGYVKIAINGKEVVNYTEPESPERPDSFKGRLINEGTFAIQGHDPNSVTFLKDIKVKVLP